MKATKLKMKSGCQESGNLLEIDSIYLTECKEDGFYKKETIYDFLIDHRGAIQVDIYPYPNVIPALSSKNEKYVKSTPNNSKNDNLLSLPREEV